MKFRRPNTSSVLQGLAWSLTFAALDAAQAAVFGNWLQSLDSFQIGFLVFALTTTVALAWIALRNPAQLRLAFANPGLLLGINGGFALGWAMFLLSVQRIEPAISFALFTGSIPLAMLFGGLACPQGRRDTGNFAEFCGKLVLLAGMVMLAGTTLAGQSGFVRDDRGAAAIGLLMSVGAGVSIAGMLVFSNRLDRTGVTPLTQFGTRFGLYLVLALAGWYLAMDAKPQEPQLATLVAAIALGIVLMAFPVFAVQKAVALVSPATIAAFAATSPFFVFIFQLFEGRVDYSPMTLAGLVVCFTGSIITVIGTSIRESLKGA
ncbi:MAG: DMT family transporter [Nitratireductor sp.]